MAVVTPLNNFLGPEGDTVTVDEQLLNTQYQLGKRAKDMDNLPLWMCCDIETFLTNLDLQANLLDKMSKTMDTCIVGQQTGSWIGHTVQKWHDHLHRHVLGKLTSFSETTKKPLGDAYTIHYSGLIAKKGPQEDSHQARNVGRSLPADIIPASEIAALIWAMQPFPILQTVLTSKGWQMAKFFKKVAGTPEESLLGIDCKHAPTTCTCFLTQNTHNCTLTRATYTLGNPEYHRQLQQQETNTCRPHANKTVLKNPFCVSVGSRFLPHSLSTYTSQTHPPAGDTIGHLNHAQDSDLTSSYSTPTTRTPLKEWS
jgi:hypothetical protein